MFKRLKISLFHPGLIGVFAKDKIWKVILYMVGCVLLMSVPFIIEVSANDIISEEDYSYLKSDILNNIDELPNSYFYDYKLYLIENDKKIVNIGGYSVGFFVMPETNIGIFLEEDYISICSFGRKILSYSYKVIGLEDFSVLKLKNTNNDLEIHQEFLKLKASLQYIDRDCKPLYATISIIISLLLLTVGYVFICLAFSLFLRMGTILKFREVFPIVVYGLSWEVFGFLISSFYGLYFIEIIMGVISMLFIWKAIQVLILNKMIQKNIEK